MAERVAGVELAIYSGAFDSMVLDEGFLLNIHRQICGDLVPEWAGHWRDIEVQVGNLRPARPFQLPVLMRDYVLDLQAQWEAASTETPSALEFLAFAEGRFLTVHPFRDFNGRTVRLLLTELLRRLDLPRVTLAPEDTESRATYFLALEAADQLDWRPLISVWEQRLVQAESS
ncbi:MAG: Fic family protein [Verrucomicrobiota bacterium]